MSRSKDVRHTERGRCSTYGAMEGTVHEQGSPLYDPEPMKREYRFEDLTTVEMVLVIMHFVHM